MKSIVYIVGGFGTEAGLFATNYLIKAYKEKITNISSDTSMIDFILSSTKKASNENYFANSADCQSSFDNVMKNIKNFILNDDYKKILIIFACNTIHTNLNKYLNNNVIDPRMKFYKLPKSINSFMDKNNQDFTRKIYFIGTKESFNVYDSELLQHNLVFFKETEIMNLIIKIKKYENITNETLKIFDDLNKNSILILGCSELSYIGQTIHKYINTDKNITIIDPLIESLQSIINDYIIFQAETD